MSRWSTCDGRAQTDPLAALVAVAALSAGLALYGGALDATLPGTTDRAVAEPTLDRVWTQVGADGVYDPATGPLDERVDAAAMPEGYAVRVEVTRRDDSGDSVTVGQAPVADGTDDAARRPPASARSARRPVPVVSGPGVVETGTLRVIVWD